AQEYPWSALGRVNLAGQGFCTGVLVAPQRVLTQARCLYSEREARWFRPFELHFVAAYQRDSYLADSAVSDFTVAPGFNPQAGTSLANLASNWALVALQQPVGQRTGWLGLTWDSKELEAAAAVARGAYLRAGYRSDRPHAVSLHFGCREDAAAAVQLCAATPSELVLPRFVVVGKELRVLADFYAATPGQAGALTRLTGTTGGMQPQLPARGSAVSAAPSATAAAL